MKQTIFENQIILLKITSM